jgi:hypothetical protein
LGGGKCIICLANPKVVGDKIKTGMHLNWPEFLVDQEGAMSIRAHVVSLLNKVYMSVKWASVVDEAVYNGSGFRMPWSHKMSKGVVEDPYLPMAIYDAPLGMAGLQKPPGVWGKVGQEPSLEHMWMSTIRAPADAVATPIQPGPQLAGKKEGGFSAALSKNEMVNSEVLAHLETFIRQNMQGQKNARLTKMFKNKSGISVATQSQYCENVQRDHSSNHVWFWANTKGHIRQRCFCTNDTAVGRRHGFCKDFSGRELQLPPSLVKKMYPENKTFEKVRKAISPNAVVNRNKPVCSNTAPIYTNSFHTPKS